MKVEMKIIGLPYNQYGCGHRIQFLIVYNRKGWTKRKSPQEQSIHLNRGLNKLIEYWNRQGVVLNRDKKRKNYGIQKEIIYTPFGESEKEEYRYFDFDTKKFSWDKDYDLVKDSKTEKKDVLDGLPPAIDLDKLLNKHSDGEKELPKRENGLNHSHGINGEPTVHHSKPSEKIYNDCVGICFTCEENKICQIPKAKKHRNKIEEKRVYKHTITLKELKEGKGLAVPEHNHIELHRGEDWDINDDIVKVKKLIPLSKGFNFKNALVPKDVWEAYKNEVDKLNDGI